MIPSFLLEKENIHINDATKRKKLSFADKTVKSAASFVSVTLLHWQSAKKSGFFQMLDGRTKIVFLVLCILWISISASLTPQILTAILLLFLIMISKLNIFFIYKRVLTAGFIFGFLIFIPASLNLFSKGENAFTLFRFPHQYNWWIYTIPREITVTYEGMQTVLRLTLKVINSITLVSLLIATTTFENIVKSLAFFRVPHVFLLTLTLTYKFVFILTSTIIEVYYAIRMRWWNQSSVKEADEIVAGRIGYLFRKSWDRYELVYQSMIARGFSGRVRFYYFEKPKPVDFLFISALVLILSLLILIFHFNARNI